MLINRPRQTGAAGYVAGQILADAFKKINMKEKELKFLEFVKLKHGDQKRKYTYEPYWTHPVAVANIVRNFGGSEIAIAAALGHDLLEDTDCVQEDILLELGLVGYSSGEARYIVETIQQLTDQYTPQAYPDLNRATRKRKEANRFAEPHILNSTHNVKCADLIDNTSSIVENDPGFARVYLGEKRDILENLKLARIDLYIETCWVYRNAIEKLKSRRTRKNKPT